MMGTHAKLRRFSAFLGELIVGTILTIGTAAVSADTFKIEVDYMGTDPNDPGGHNHMPSQLVLDAVVQMFACQGHTLTIDLDDQIPHMTTLIGDPTADCGDFWNYTGASNTYRSIRNTWFDHEGEAGWHYCVFAHQWSKDNDPNNPNSGCVGSGSSGRANGVDCLIVTLGTVSGQYAQAATLAHEFGHNLGLSHCGTMNCVSNSNDGSSNYVGPFVPVMPSVMSYTFQLSGVKTQMLALGLTVEEALYKEIDYSHGRLCTVDETDLDELRGTTMVSTDWDCDGMLEASVVQDINESLFWCGTNGNLTISVSDFNEWANIVDVAALAASSKPADQAIVQQRKQWMHNMRPCISHSEWQQIQQEFQFRGGGPPLTVEPCINGQNVFIGTSLVNIGTCELPYDGIQMAHDLSPNNSVFFIVPGTYHETANLVLDKPGKYLCETGTATID